MTTELVMVAHPITGELRTVRRKVPRSCSGGERGNHGPEVCPPLVSEEVFAQVQTQLAANK
jgi:hypothetical protein